MKYLVVLPEVAYITRNDGKGVLDAWDAPNGRLFKAAKAVEISEETSAPEAFKMVGFAEPLKKNGKPLDDEPKVG